MARLTVPAGQTLRQVAQRLGVTIQDLGDSAALHADVVQDVDQAIEVRDGFMKQVDRNRRSVYAAVPKTERPKGLNTALALDLEYLKNLISGGLGQASDQELEALSSAQNAYLRFEPKANTLAIDLWGQLLGSSSAQVRSIAHAGRSVAFAHGSLLFGQDPQDTRLQAISEARAAQASDPNYTTAHLGYALGLAMQPEAGDIESAQQQLELGIHLNSDNAWLWYGLAMLIVLNQSDTVQLSNPVEFLDRALVLEPNHPLALEMKWHLDSDTNDSVIALALRHSPTATRLKYIQSLLTQTQDEEVLDIDFGDQHTKIALQNIKGMYQSRKQGVCRYRLPWQDALGTATVR